MGKNIDYKSKHNRLIPKKNVLNDKKLIYKEFDKLFNKFQDSILVVSYRSDGIPSESELKELICQYKTNVKIKKYGNINMLYLRIKNLKNYSLLVNENIWEKI